MTDIVERLRASCEDGIDPDAVYEAADTIAALRARVAEAELLLREWHSLYQCTVEEEEHRLRRTADWLRDAGNKGESRDGT